MAPRSVVPSLSRSIGSRLFFRLSLVAIPGILAIILVGAVGLLAFNELGRQNSTVQQAIIAESTARTLAGKMDNLVASLDQLTIPGNQYNTMIYSSGRGGVESDLTKLQNLDVSFAPETEATRNGTVITLRGSLIDLDRVNNPPSSDLNARYMLWTGGIRDGVIANTKAIHDLADGWQRAEQFAIAANNRLFELGRNVIAVLIIVTVLASLLGTMIRTYNVMRPISRLQTNMGRLAAGDLTIQRDGTTKPSSARHDELEALEDVYQRTLATLRPLILHIQEDAHLISQSAKKISTNAALQDRDANEQATAITQITVTVEQLNQTAVQIADAAASVASAAEQALLSANRGQEAVRDSIIGMAMIRSRVNDITARILALSAQSQRISEIIDVIDQIASQTHILALNAAVESAGAGGAIGDRFGVVASEIKKLAQRSALATKEVRTVIAQVQAATNAAVMATEDGLKETEKGVAMAHQSGDANEDIIGMIERTAQLSQAISLATQQQRTASEQVVATIREVAHGTQHSAAGSHQAFEEAEQLAAIANELGAFARNFHIESEPESSSESNSAGPATPDGTDPSSRARGARPATV